MTKDYAKKTTHRNKNKRQPQKPKGVPGWVWLLAGIMIGSLATTLIKLADVVPENTAQRPNKAAQTTKKEPRFDFYDLLRESEVIIPNNEALPKIESTTAQSSVYLLQAGSFKHVNDADSLRARLLLLNLEASIEKVSPRPGETWHRVLVGPFSSSSKLASARAKLASNQIESLLLKRKQ